MAASRHQDSDSEEVSQSKKYKKDDIDRDRRRGRSPEAGPRGYTREEGRRDRDPDGKRRDRRPRNGHVSRLHDKDHILERLPEASRKSKRDSDSEDGTMDRRKNDSISEHSSGSPHKQRSNDHTREEDRRDRDPDGMWRDRRPRNDHVILERLPKASGKSKRESDSEDGTMDRRKNDRLGEHSSGSPHKQRNNDRTREEGRRDRDPDGKRRDRRPRNGHVSRLHDKDHILERLPEVSGKSKRESDSEDGTMDRRKNDRLSEHSSGSPHKQRNNDHTREEDRRDRDPDGKRRDRRPRNDHVSRLHVKDHILERIPEASGKLKRESDSEDGTMDRRKNDRLSENSSGSPHKQRNDDRHSSGEDSESDMGRKDKRHLKKYNGRKSERSHSHRDRNHHRSYKDSDLGDKYEERVKDDRNLYTKERSESPKPWLDRAGNMKGEEEEKKQQPPVQQMADAVTIKTGGIYIPPHRMAQMMRDVQDKSSEAYQRLSWDALKKSINGLVNKVNATNIKNIIPELFSENLIRGRGLFCRSCIKSQTASPGFTNIFAALVAVVNTKFPDVGKLLLKRVMLQFKRSFARNDKPQLLAAMKFIAHLVNQQVAHEVIALELLTVLLLNPTDDSVEVAVGFVKECGALLQDLVPLGLYGVFERFRGILHEGEIDKRVQFLIEALFAIRKAKFQGFPAIRAELDLVEQEDQFTHEMSFEDVIDPEFNLDVFKLNPQFLEDEKAYENLKKNILGDESSENEAGSDEGSDDEDEEKSEEEDEEQMKIKDETETNLVNLRRTIYLTIMSSVDFEEAGHKLLKIKLEPGQEMELCIMLLECCSQERTYLRYYGLLGQRFCMINKVHQENFEKCFVHQYSMIHRLETNKLRNVAKFFAHLLGTDALPWHVLSYIRLTEEDTTSSSRIFIKILFQELSEHLGIRLLNERLNDPNMQDSFDSIFPKDNPKNTRFAINFFTSIGLGGITENLRNYLKNMPRLIMQQQKPVSDSSGSVSDSSSSSSSSGSESESESESSSDDSRSRGKRQRRR